MKKIFKSLGLMSGTSMDGVDASIIETDGKSNYKPILDKYFKYPKDLYKNLVLLRDNIKTPKDLKKCQKQLKTIEKKITIFHAKSVNTILKKTNFEVDFIGFHGQTILHSPEKKITKQLGDGKLLSQLTKKKVIYDFRQNDLKNGGDGAPLSPIFHELIAFKYRINPPSIFVNIGGIANYTFLRSQKIKASKFKNLHAGDLCLGNCLIDNWIRNKSEKIFDEDGKIAKSGIINKTKLKKALNIYKVKKKRSLDIKDFNLSFVNGLSLKDGAATLTEYTAQILANHLITKTLDNIKIILCGGGRKNKFLVKKIKNKIPHPILLIDNYGIKGDFVESQAFGYLAIRSFLKLPISFPVTTRCRKPCTGGIIVKSF